MFQDDGTSMDVIGIGVCSRREMMAGKGGRISPEKEKPAQFDVWDALFWWKRVRCGGWGEDGERVHTEDGVDDMTSGFQIRFEVFREGDVELLKLGC